MSKTRYLKIQFENRLFPYEVPCFRAAVIEKTKRQSDLFHNHLGDEKYIYRYPLIQYKIANKKAAIICLEDGTDDIHYFLQNRQLDLQIGERRETFCIEDIHLRYYNIQTWDTPFYYSILNWIALNQKNIKIYSELEGQIERIAFLEKILTASIISFAKGIGWNVQRPIKLAITAVKEQRTLPYKRTKVFAFSLNFKVNVSLPDFVGLGKGTSTGFGIIKQFHYKTENVKIHERY